MSLESILILIKKLIGIEEEYTHFDTDIIAAINSAIMTLTQIGIGPDDGFFIIDDKATWNDFLGDRTDLEATKMFILLSVRLSFDPPTNSFLVEAIRKQIEELTWRLSIITDGLTY